MKIETADINTIKPYENNPRKLKDSAIDKVAMSLKEYGFRQPIVVDKDRIIVVGHTRYRASKKLGFKEVPITIADNLTPEQINAYRIADNRTAEESEWDSELLKMEIKDLEDKDFKLDLLGFNEDQLNDMLFEEKQGLTDEDEVPEAPEEPISKLGDIWKLGNHRVMCGDSTIQDNIDKLLNNNKIDLVFTDPPYGMFLNTDYSSQKSSLSFMKEKGVYGGKKYDKVIGDNEDFKPEFIKIIFDNFNYCKEIFLWGADYYSEYLSNKNDGSWVVWDKRLDEKADKMYGSTFELCWSKKKHKRMLARVKWAGIFGTEKEFDKKRHHPTQKPVALVEWFFDYFGFKKLTNVFDCYLGAGTTLIACEKNHKICYGMELDPKYCDVIIKRWENFTGKKAELENGQN